ncbi:fec operon regulator FecR [compost metagenome]
MDNVFGMAAAPGDSRREPNQALAPLKEQFKQLGTAPRRIGLLHDAPELFYESASEGRKFILIKNYLQQISGAVSRASAYQSLLGSCLAPCRSCSYPRGVPELNQNHGTWSKLAEIFLLPAMMTKLPCPQKSTSEIAADWCVRLHFSECTDADRAQFRCWHDADPAHAAEYAKMCRIWQISEQLPESFGVDMAGRSRWRQRFLPLMTRAAMVLATVGAVWGAGWSAGMLPGSVRYFMAQDVRQQVLLPDHSQVQLNQRTGLVYLGFRDQRQVLLRNGEAYFDVQQDREKPFVIRADNASIRVTGTHFNVWTGHELTTVTVTQGSVLASRNDDSKQGAVLTAGMQAAFGPDRMVQLGRTDPSRASAWRNGKLMLDDVSLREALPLINRYLDVPLKLADSEVGDLRFGGIYDTAELGHMVNALPQVLPVKLRHSDQVTLLIKR